MGGDRLGGRLLHRRILLLLLVGGGLLRLFRLARLVAAHATDHGGGGPRHHGGAGHGANQRRASDSTDSSSAHAFLLGVHVRGGFGAAAGLVLEGLQRPGDGIGIEPVVGDQATAGIPDGADQASRP